MCSRSQCPAPYRVDVAKSGCIITRASRIKLKSSKSAAKRHLPFLLYADRHLFEFTLISEPFILHQIIVKMGTIKVLIIDHYDSYTNNILQLLQGTQKGHDGKSYPEWSVAIVRFDQFSW
jgi:hypothetical protein